MPTDFESRSRSSLTSATYTAIALVFFFGVGLAGGAAYKVYFGDDAGPQVADRESPPLQPSTPSSPAQNFAADNATPDLARIEPSAPPALAPPPAPTPAEATKPHAPAARVAQAAPPPAASPAQTPQAAPAEPAPLPYATVVPAKPDVQPETPAAKPTHVAAVPPKKPAMVAKAHRTAPSEKNGPHTVALHEPPSAPGNAAGPFRVQFGAFANEDNARRVQWAVEATGLKVDVSQEPGPSGHPLFFLRSPSYPDYASALSAAQTVQHRVHGFVNAIPIDYEILGDRSALEQQAQR